MTRILQIIGFGFVLHISAVTTIGAETATVTEHSAVTSTATTTQVGAKKPVTKLKLQPNDTVIYVKDLHCGHCAKKIASKLYAVKGVVKVRTDLKADVAIVSPQAKKKLDPMQLWNAAKTSGFPAIKLVGPAGTYVPDPKTQAAKLVPAKRVTTKKS